MNTNIRTVSVHDTLFGRVANNLEVGQLSRAHSGAIGGNQNGGSVFIGSGDHQHVVPGHSHVARENIGGNSETGNVTNVARAVGIGPCNGRQNTTHGPLV